MAMYTDGDDPAFATPDLHNQNGLTYMGSPGLTKREYFAAIAMQGLLSNQNSWETGFDEIANSSIHQADELIKALNK